MQEPPPRGPGPGDAAPYVEDDQPATVGELRSVKRWLAVAAVWAVAATALGVIALLEATKDDSSDQEQAAGALSRVQRDLDNRIDELESRIDDLPTSEDVSRLDSRVSDVEQAADQNASRAERLGTRVDDLEGRVEELEQAAQTETTETTP